MFFMIVSQKDIKFNIKDPPLMTEIIKSKLNERFNLAL